LQLLHRKMIETFMVIRVTVTSERRPSMLSGTSSKVTTFADAEVTTRKKGSQMVLLLKKSEFKVSTTPSDSIARPFELVPSGSPVNSIRNDVSVISPHVSDGAADGAWLGFLLDWDGAPDGVVLNCDGLPDGTLLGFSLDWDGPPEGAWLGFPLDWDGAPDGALLGFSLNCDGLPDGTLLGFSLDWDGLSDGTLVKGTVLTSDSDNS
jgi:hypothetical protein